MLQHQAFEATAQLTTRSEAAAAPPRSPTNRSWTDAGRFDPARARFPRGLDKVVPGGLGVTIFFFISGFLITSLLISEFQREAHFAEEFYLRRFWRWRRADLLHRLVDAADRSVPQGGQSRRIAVAILYFANYYSIYCSTSPAVRSFAAEGPLEPGDRRAFLHRFRAADGVLRAHPATPVPAAADSARHATGDPVRGRPRRALDRDTVRVHVHGDRGTDRLDRLGALLAWLCSHVGAARLKALLDNDIAVGASLGLLL